MNKTRRNFGFGKQPRYAAKQALADIFGKGRYGTRHSHLGRIANFLVFMVENGLRDYRSVTIREIENYADCLCRKIDAGTLAVATAQNRISSVNVLFEALRRDRELWVSPAGRVGKRRHVRHVPPLGMDIIAVNRVVSALDDAGHPTIAAAAYLSRTLGLRLKEAALMDSRTAVSQSYEVNKVDIRRGTKGGRGRNVERLVPVSDGARSALEFAARVSSTAGCLIPGNKNWRQWSDYAHRCFPSIARTYGLSSEFRDLRASYACMRYLELTACPAPVVAGKRLATRELDRMARRVVARELGHSRTDVVASYCGSAK